MNRNEQLQQAVESVGEMADSAQAVKGGPFAFAVSALFGLDGIHDLSSRLIDATPVAKRYVGTLNRLRDSVQEAILELLPQSERQEARNYATRMFNEQRLLHERIAREGT